ncbi:MAG: hypothetical protein IJE89_04230 [Bacilli bacterium]|nr:hypothetical protein [Bacilli bacterium]
MDKKNMMRDFITIINDRGLMTKFIKNIFGYNNFFNHNYIFRFIDETDKLIIDIYDNITDARFNRYIFNFNKCKHFYKKDVVNKLNIHYISISTANDSNDNLIKLAYMFKIENNKMLDYAETFLDKDFILILRNIIK